MNKTTATTATAVTGIAVAMAAGTAAYMATHKHSATSKKIKRNASKAVKTLGNVLSSMEGMMR